MPRTEKRLSAATIRGLSQPGRHASRDAIVICIDDLILPLDERSYVGRQALLERCFISSLSNHFVQIALDLVILTDRFRGGQGPTKLKEAVDRGYRATILCQGRASFSA
jgi:hypothetical protein